LAHKQTGDILDVLELACKHREAIANDLRALASQASDGELAALISYAVAFPERFTALVDTYDVKRYVVMSLVYSYNNIFNLSRKFNVCF